MSLSEYVAVATKHCLHDQPTAVRYLFLMYMLKTLIDQTCSMVMILIQAFKQQKVFSNTELFLYISDLENHCARTAAVFVPRAGGKSHIKGSISIYLYRSFKKDRMEDFDI